MYQFLKSYLSFMLCFFVVLMGCTNTKTSKEFSHTMEDGGRVNIKIEYKPKSQISGDEKFGSYYYIVQYIAPKPSPSAKTSEQQGKTKPMNFEDKQLSDKGSLEQQDKTKSLARTSLRDGGTKSLEQQGKTKTDFETRRQRAIQRANESLTDEHRDELLMALRQREQPPGIWISFYDRNGYSLFTAPRGIFFPAYHANEENQIDGGWEWKGQFDESYITVENFREIHSIKVK